MGKKLLVIPDIHGETFWREPVQRYIDQVDRIVFLGDYLDPYRDEGKTYTPQGLFDNLMDIICRSDIRNCNAHKEHRRTNIHKQGATVI